MLVVANAFEIQQLREAAVRSYPAWFRRNIIIEAATGDCLMLSDFLERPQSTVSSFCYAQCRVCYEAAIVCAIERLRWTALNASSGTYRVGPSVLKGGFLAMQRTG